MEWLAAGLFISQSALMHVLPSGFPFTYAVIASLACLRFVYNVLHIKSLEDNSIPNNLRCLSLAWLIPDALILLGPSFT